MDHRPNYKCHTLKLLEDKIGENLDDLEFDDGFLSAMPEAQFMKENVDKLDFIKIKNFCSAKDNVKRMRRQPQMRRKYLQDIYVIKVSSPKYTEHIQNR